MDAQLAAINKTVGPIYSAGHYTTKPENCPKLPFCEGKSYHNSLLDNLLIRDGQFVESSIWTNAQELHANTTTSVHHAMGITLSFDVQEIGLYLESGRLLTLECDIAHTKQLY